MKKFKWDDGRELTLKDIGVALLCVILYLLTQIPVFLVAFGVWRDKNL